jgi:preprotein translocase subunit YajC
MYLYGQSQQPVSPAGGMLGALIPFAIIFVIFYLLIIMPARKKQKQHAAMVSSLKGGERIVTAGGIYGTVSRVMDDRVEIQVDSNTRLQVAKSSVSLVVEPSAKG